MASSSPPKVARRIRDGRSVVCVGAERRPVRRDGFPGAVRGQRARLRRLVGQHREPRLRDGDATPQANVRPRERSVLFLRGPGRGVHGSGHGGVRRGDQHGGQALRNEEARTHGREGRVQGRRESRQLQLRGGQRGGRGAAG